MKSYFFKLILLCAILLVSVCGHTQNKFTDSLSAVLQLAKEDTIKVRALNAMATYFKSNNPDTAIYFASEALSLATKINDEPGIIAAYLNRGFASSGLGEYKNALQDNTLALQLCDQLLGSNKKINAPAISALKANAYASIGSVYQEQGNYNEALKSAREALKIKQEMNDKDGIARQYNNIGNIYGDLGNFSEAIKHYFSSLKIKEEIGDKKSIANSYNNIGSSYYEQRQYTEALAYHFTALKIRQEINDKSGIANSYNNIGIIYEDEGKYTEALKYHTASLEIMQQLGSKPGIANSYGNIGILYMHQEDNDKALKYFSDYLKISEEMEDQSGIADACISLGEVNAKENRNSVAASYFNKALDLAKEMGDPDFIKEAYKGLAYTDSVQGNFKQSLQHYKLFVEYRDSIFNEQNTKKLVQSQMQYEFDKKEAAQKDAQKKREAQTKHEKNIQYVTIGFLGVLLVSILIIALIQYRNNKQKQKANILLLHEKEKAENTLAELKTAQFQLIQSEKMASLGELTAGIAHEIQNPLNFVNNFSEINAELINELIEETDKKNYNEIKLIAGNIKDNEEKINHHGKRAGDIVKGMLQHSRTSSGKKEPTDINALTEEYARLAYHGARAKDRLFNATIKTDFDSNIEKIPIVPQDIGRVILNLTNNAFYAVKPPNPPNAEEYKPTVIITTKKMGDTVLISVKDNGSGIKQNIIDKIFQPFFTTKPTGQGTGLGLSLSYDIVKAHGGEIRVETKEGEGATFTIELPNI